MTDTPIRKPNLTPLIRSAPPKLTDLLSASTLQHIQDLFVNLTGITTVIRDEKGEMITKPGMRNGLCALISETEDGDRLCAEANLAALRRMKPSDGPAPYTCHAGMLHYMAPICVEGHCLGTIVMGDMPRAPLSEDQIRELAGRLGLDENALRERAAHVRVWPEERVHECVRFLQSLANALAGFCYQGFQMRQRLDELKILYNFTKLLNSTLRLDEVLRLSIENVAAALNVKACSLRLLDPEKNELVIKSCFNLSEEYLNKGPVRIADSVIDRESMSGKAVYVEDIQNDPRILYPEQARKEGLRSGLSVGLICKGHAIGTIHIYSAEKRRFTEEELRIFRALANQAAIAIETARLNEATLEKERGKGADIRIVYSILDALEIAVTIQQEYGVRMDSENTSREVLQNVATLAGYIQAQTDIRQ
jgi:ligand-binding sensor protein